MKVSRLNNLLRPNRVYRGIAVFFLLFTFVDLACPGLCQDEFTDLFPIPQTQSIADTMTPTDADDAGQQGEQNSQPGSLEEDCFCCCPHLLPVCAPDSSDNTTVLHKYPIRLINLPTAWPNGTDHPPRSASC